MGAYGLSSQQGCHVGGGGSCPNMITVLLSHFRSKISRRWLSPGPNTGGMPMPIRSTISRWWTFLLLPGEE